MGDGLSSFKTIRSLYAIKRVENKAADALSYRIFILTKMSIVVNGFEKIKAEYETCPNFCNIYAILMDGSTQEVDDYTLHDGYLFLG